MCVIFVDVSSNVKQGTQLKMSTTGSDMGRFAFFICDLLIFCI